MSNKEESNKRSLRHKAALTGALLATSLVGGHDPQHHIKPAAPLTAAASGDNDFDKAYASALAKADEGCRLFAEDMKRMQDTLGIVQLLLLKRVEVHIISAHEGNDGAVYFTLNRNNKKHSLPGLAKLLDACVELERLTGQRNKSLPIERRGQVDYGTIAHKLWNDYAREGGNETLAQSESVSLLTARLLETFTRHSLETDAQIPKIEMSVPFSSPIGNTAIQLGISVENQKLASRWRNGVQPKIQYATARSR